LIALFLAAGSGIRLKPLTDETHKALLMVHNQSILEKSLTKLEKTGIKEIYLVLGHLKKQVIHILRSLHMNLTFKFIDNPRYKETNNLYSLWLGLQEVRQPFVCLEADVLYHEEILARLINSPYENVIVIDDKMELSDQDTKVMVEGDRLVGVDKKVPLGSAGGKFTGLAKFSSVDLLYEISSGLIEAGFLDEYYDAAIHNLAQKAEVHVLSVDTFPWIEVDDQADLERARTMNF